MHNATPFAHLRAHAAVRRPFSTLMSCSPQMSGTNRCARVWSPCAAAMMALWAQCIKQPNTCLHVPVN